jgi:hypothetical protein
MTISHQALYLMTEEKLVILPLKGGDSPHPADIVRGTLTTGEMHLFNYIADESMWLMDLFPDEGEVCIINVMHKLYEPEIEQRAKNLRSLRLFFKNLVNERLKRGAEEGFHVRKDGSIVFP